MKLFPEDSSKNWLPYNGEVNYYGVVLSDHEADDYFHSLFNDIAWRNNEVVIFGKLIITAIKLAWYADQSFPHIVIRVQLSMPYLRYLNCKF